MTKKRPLNAGRPFPWQCHRCGKSTVNMSHVDYHAAVRHDGRLHSFMVQNLEIPVCDSCGEKVFTEDVDRQIKDGLRLHLTLLAPEQIRGALDRIGLTQKELAERLGIAEATISRWVSATQIQSRSLDRLMRVFFAFSCVRESLASSCIAASLGTGGVDDTCFRSAHQRPGQSEHRKLRRIRIPSQGTGWNGSREACRPVQNKVQMSGSTWCIPKSFS